MESNEQEKQPHFHASDCIDSYCGGCSSVEPVSSSKAEEKIELPLKKYPIDILCTIGVEQVQIDQRDADQKEVDRLSQDLKEKDEQIAELKKVLEVGCQNEDSQCIYQAENAALTERIKELEGIIKLAEGQMDFMNGLLGDETNLCIYCKANIADGTGIVHKSNCVLNTLRKSIAQSTNTEEGK